jgi:acetyltransferase-like isoleucine patch superfamily enzyme
VEVRPLRRAAERRGATGGPSNLLLGLIGVLPSCAFKRGLMRRLLGWDVHETARVGPCFLRGVEEMVLRKNATISGFSVVLHVAHLSLGEGAIVGYWNWLAAAPTLRTVALDARAAGRAARIDVGDNAAITSRHYIDCSGGVDIGRFTVLAGVRSTILTHQVDTLRSEQTLQGVTIGSYCLVGSNVDIVPGAHIPDRSVIAMGSVVAGTLEEQGSLYAGVPARRIRSTGNGEYFRRKAGFADIP